MNLRKTKLTLRAVLYGTLGVAGWAELVQHPGDVLHPSVHHGLHVVHVEQVELLQTTVQGRDLAPGVAQAGWHPVELHLRKGPENGSEKECFWHQLQKQVDYWRHQPTWIFKWKRCLRDDWPPANTTETPQAYQAGEIYRHLAAV